MRVRLVSKIEEDQSSRILLTERLSVRYVASFRNWSASQSKIMPNFDIFDPAPSVTLLDGTWAKCLSQNEARSSLNVEVLGLVQSHQLAINSN